LGGGPSPPHKKGGAGHLARSLLETSGGFGDFQGYPMIGDSDDLLALLASGKLEKRQLEMAAALGHKRALATGARGPALPEHYRSKIKMAASLLSHHDAVSFAVDCAIRVLDNWESIRPTDKRPREVLKATRSWLLRQEPEESLPALVESASDAGIEARDPGQMQVDRALAAGIFAANSAAHAGLAAQHASAIARPQEADPDGIEDCVAYAGRFAVSAAGDPDAEREWQLKQLANYLLKQAEPLWGTWQV
jgi:hypothetical protein